MAAQDTFNAALEAKIASTAKECPGCKSEIEKNGGCDHMTCKSLPHQFIKSTYLLWGKAANVTTNSASSASPIINIFIDKAIQRIVLAVNITATILSTLFLHKLISKSNSSTLPVHRPEEPKPKWQPCGRF